MQVPNVHSVSFALAPKTVHDSELHLTFTARHRTQQVVRVLHNVETDGVKSDIGLRVLSTEHGLHGLHCLGELSKARCSSDLCTRAHKACKHASTQAAGHTPRHCPISHNRDTLSHSTLHIRTHGAFALMGFLGLVFFFFIFFHGFPNLVFRNVIS
jgi:hypothetical protein